MIIKKCFFEWLGIIIMIISGSLFMTSCTKDNNGDDEDDGTKESTLTGRFAFVSYGDGDGEIYTVNADGTNLQRLTDNTANNVQPCWSPDGSKIAFNSYGYRMPSEITVMNSDGSNIISITQDPVDVTIGEEWPSWSPDGSKIVYESYRDAKSEDNGTTIINANLYISNSDGSGGDIRLTNHLFYEGNPAWSPDGSKVAFVHAKVDTIGSALYSTGYQIWVMNANGSNWKKLTTSGSNNIRPKWAPDGAKLVYQADEGISVVTLEGVNQVLVNYGGNPSWSPDGTKIVFDRNDEIHVMNADRTNVKKIALAVEARQVVWTE